MPTVFGLNIILSLSGEQVKHVNYYIHNVLHLILWITLTSINYKAYIVKIETHNLLSLLDAYFPQEEIEVDLIDHPVVV